MKHFILIPLISLSLYASEMDRIEAIVNDIQNLRKEYAECKEQLSTKQPELKANDKELESLREENIAYKKTINKMKIENIDLLSKIDLMEKNKNNEKILKETNSILKIKEKEIKNLKNKIIKFKKDKENSNNSLVLIKKETVLCVDDNQFPDLIMKENIETKVEVLNTISSENELNSTQARTYRLSKQSDIYDSINGKIVQNWSKETSFTSNIMTDGWVKITGYFVDAAWQKSQVELWINKENIIQR